MVIHTCDLTVALNMIHSTTLCHSAIMSTNEKRYKGSSLQYSPKILWSYYKTPECWEMPTTYISQCPCKTIDIVAFIGLSWYQFLRCFAKLFTSIGGTCCLKYLCTKCKIKYFWGNVASKVWHSNYIKWEIICFIKIWISNLLCSIWFPNQEMTPQNNLYCPFWAQA